MGIPTIDMNDRKVFRDKLKEHRDSYYVSYQPADARYSFAFLHLTFPEGDFDASTVRQAMERELEIWLTRYPVPVMISAFDAKDDLISFSDEFGGSNLIGYVELPGRTVVRRWGLSKNDESQVKEMDDDYLERVYRDVPFKLQKEVREKVNREARTNGRIIRIFVFFVFGVPVLIEIVSLGIEWIGYIVSGISISTGLYKTAKAMGWLKPSKRDKEKAEKDLKMEHYFYHCEKNPDGFNRLKFENFDREAIEQTRKESESLRKKQP
jgi:hypothetical protein